MILLVQVSTGNLLTFVPVHIRSGHESPARKIDGYPPCFSRPLRWVIFGASDYPTSSFVPLVALLPPPFERKLEKTPTRGAKSDVLCYGLARMSRYAHEEMLRKRRSHACDCLKRTRTIRTPGLSAPLPSPALLCALARDTRVVHDHNAALTYLERLPSCRQRTLFFLQGRHQLPLRAFRVFGPRHLGSERYGKR